MAITPFIDVASSGINRKTRGGGGSGTLAFMQGMQSLASGFTSFTGGKIKRRLSKAQKRLLEKKARRAEKLGQQAEARIRQKGKKVRGAQRASTAAQGIRLGSGSARDIALETEDITELDALTVRNNAAREALGFKTGAIRAGTRGKLAFQKGIGEAGQTLLTGGLQAYRSYRGV